MKINELRSLVRETISRVINEKMAFPKDSIRVSQLKKGDILGGSGLEVVNISSGATTPSGKIEVTVKDPKTGKELTKVWNKSTTVTIKENAPAPSKPKETPGPAVAPGKPDTGKPKPRRPLGNPDVKPAPKAMNEEEMLKKIVARFKSKK